MAYTIESLVARAAMAAIFLWSGLGKLTGLDETAGYIASAGLPFPYLAALGASAFELGAGALLLTGRWLCLSASLLAAYSLPTAAIFHRVFDDQNQLIHFMKNLSMAGGLASVALTDYARRVSNSPEDLRRTGSVHARIQS